MRFVLDIQFFASKKGVSSTKNGRDSAGRRLGAKKADGEYVTIPDRKEAIRYCLVNAKEGDIVVLAGKGHEDYQEIKGVKHHMDEREIVAAHLEERKNRR